ncbi:Uncharacterized protein TCM_016314 [Theobroma cacao]|uniref:Uncharacterized protein n=1 Tax=Theobroma cacao TaxID=3641 RepID=A0A061G6J9_THECC|nr:Uncharacterized protein TCM_016314 [Theobroma cacao]
METYHCITCHQLSLFVVLCLELQLYKVTMICSNRHLHSLSWLLHYHCRLQQREPSDVPVAAIASQEFDLD